MSTKKRKRVPKHRSEDQERDFWASADSTEYVDWRKAQRVVFPNLKPSLKTISLRLPEMMLAELKALANKRDVPYQSLMKMFLAERITVERGGPHRLDHLAAFLRWTPQFLLPPVREILRGGEPEGKVPLRMFFQASVHLLRRRPSVRRVRSLAVV